MIDAEIHLEVLLVEDNPGDVALIEASLSEAGMTGVTLHPVHRLSEGLELLRQTHIDVILLDLALPDSDGLTTLAKARAEAPSIPVLVLTGLDDAETGAKAVRAGAQDYLIKGQTEGLALVRSMVFGIERKRAEKPLASEMELLRAVERSVPFGMFAVDARGRLIYVNEPFCELVGWPREELLGARTPLPYWPPGQAPVLETVTQPVAVQLRRRDGTPVNVTLRSRTLTGTQREALGWLAVVEPVNAA